MFVDDTISKPPYRFPVHGKAAFRSGGVTNVERVVVLIQAVDNGFVLRKGGGPHDHVAMKGRLSGGKCTLQEDGMKKGKKSAFSVVKAVKANARARLGTPPPERVLPDPKRKAGAEPKHKETLTDLLNRTGDE